MAASWQVRRLRTVLLLLSCFGAGFAVNTYYLEDACTQFLPATIELTTSGNQSSASVRAYRSGAPMTTQKCLTILVVSTPPPGRIAVSIRDLDMEVDKKENFCVDYVDIQGSDSIVSRFCGSLENTVTRSFASKGNQLRLVWNSWTTKRDRRGFDIVLTAFTEPDGHADSNFDDQFCTEEGMFSCENGRCIDAQWRCDRRDNCGDDSDERDCWAADGLTSSALWLGMGAGALVTITVLLVMTALWKCRGPRPMPELPSSIQSPRYHGRY